MGQIISTQTLKSIFEVQPLEPQNIVIVSRTEPAMRKTNNPYFGKVFKVSTVSGLMNWSYARQVNLQRQREGGLIVVDGLPQIKTTENFVSHERKWGTRLKNSPFVEHKGEFYLELMVQEAIRHEYRDETGEPFDVELIRPYLQRTSRSNRQGTDKEVILRDYRLDRVIAVTFPDRKMSFLVSNEPQTPAEVA